MYRSTKELKKGSKKSSAKASRRAPCHKVVSVRPRRGGIRSSFFESLRVSKGLVFGRTKREAKKSFLLFQTHPPTPFSFGKEKGALWRERASVGSIQKGDKKEVKMKELLKEALLEIIKERREIFIELITEAMEDLALANAIKEGRKDKFVPEEEIMNLL